MKIDNTLKLAIENFAKCHVMCDADTSLGQLYDFACAFHNFVTQKIKESEVAKPDEPVADHSVENQEK